MKRVAIIGASGFIGGHLLNALAKRKERKGREGLTLRALTRSPGRFHGTGIEAAKLDANDAVAVRREISRLRRGDVLINLVASPAEARSAEGWQHAREDTKCLLNILEALRGRGKEAALLIHFGSAAQYGEGAGVGGNLDEGAPRRPETPYGIEKEAQERYCRLYTAEYGLRIVVLLPANIYGEPGLEDVTLPGHGLIDIVAGLTAAGKRPTLRNGGRDVRDFIHAVDVAALVARIVDSPKPGTFNVATGKGTRVIDAVLRLRRLMRADSRTAPRIEPGRGEARRLVLNPRRAMTAYGWRPEITLTRGLRMVARHYVHNKDAQA